MGMREKPIDIGKMSLEYAYSIVTDWPMVNHNHVFNQGQLRDLVKAVYQEGVYAGKEIGKKEECRRWISNQPGSCP